MNTTGVDDRHVLITGGASGIGLQTARTLHGQGARLTLVDVDGPRLEVVADELGASAQVADVTDEQQLSAAVAGGVDDHGELYAAVNCAGTGTFGPITDLPLEEWHRVVELCLTGVFLSIKHEAPHLVEGGAVVNIASLNARLAAEGMAAYCAAKAGVEMLTKVAALELAPRSIRVNAVAPGLIDTPLSAPLMQPPIRDEYVDNTPLGRPGTVEDVADAVSFLCSPASRWISGDTLFADGGAHLQRYPRLRRLGEAPQA